MRAKIYIEGGGDSAVLDPVFRQAWTNFFERAGLSGGMPRIVRGQGRDHTFDQFQTAVKNPEPDTLPLLLVDSEDPLASGHTVWQHLRARDQWVRPDGADNDQAFLMVQVMEAWIVADRDTLRTHFGQCFNESSIPAWPNLESVPKDSLYKALDSATAKCKTPYAKGKVSFTLLSKLNPDTVAAKCPHAKQLLDRLHILRVTNALTGSTQ